MASPLLFTASALAILLTSLPPLTDARDIFVQRLPNGANVPGIKAVGHTDGTGKSSAQNAFGRAFYQAGSRWTTALCQADTDRDGQTNGQELGDPCCVWTEGSTPKFTTGVSHPGLASKTVSAAVLASNACASSGSNTAVDTTSAPTNTTTAPTGSSSASQALVAVSTVAATAVAMLIHWY